MTTLESRGLPRFRSQTRHWFESFWTSCRPAQRLKRINDKPKYHKKKSILTISLKSSVDVTLTLLHKTRCPANNWRLTFRLNCNFYLPGRVVVLFWLVWLREGWHPLPRMEGVHSLPRRREEGHSPLPRSWTSSHGQPRKQQVYSSGIMIIFKIFDYETHYFDAPIHTFPICVFSNRFLDPSEKRVNVLSTYPPHILLDSLATFMVYGQIARAAIWIQKVYVQIQCTSHWEWNIINFYKYISFLRSIFGYLW